MKNPTNFYTLSNGVEIPSIGFGTWQAHNGEVAISSVVSAIEAGYRHIDTAQLYRNEESVGIAVKKSGVDRKELFITSKLENNEHGYEKTLAAFEGTMKKLDMDYLDLFLIHWPNPIASRDQWQEDNAGTWKAFEELYRAKRIRAIGISNFHPHHIEELLKTATIVPMVNQIRLCPGETQDEIVDYCRSKNMLLEAYSPLGVGKIFEVPEMQELSKKYNRSIAQICIRWSLQRGYLPLPKSVTPERIKENLDVFDFNLEDADVQLISNLKGCVGYSANPDTITF
ncbi:aldo/keto reductase [Scatolibacter rhodanostii]|uniref:aldo/keto reductase n=1 Tax=Scatolibacter rhodanostii TaxID=2014781 RepID=UPI000C07F6C0|nr:aldo/keto reductase [Scatolibacter rhodanostii]